jgi:hypothetical protein
VTTQQGRLSTRSAQATAVALAAMLWMSGAEARADDRRVELVAEVVHVSNQGDQVDPPSLEVMKRKFAAQGLSFSSFKRLEVVTLALEAGKPQAVKLPNASRAANLKLTEIKEGTAHVTVEVPKAGINASYTLGREGSLYIDVGKHSGGKLILVLSPITAAPPAAKP